MTDFITYVDAIDAILARKYCLSVMDAGISFDELGEAQDAGWKPSEWVKWFAEKHDLTPKGGAIDLTTQARIRAAGKATKC